MEDNSVFQDIDRVISRIEEIRRRFGYKKKLYYPSFESIYNRAMDKNVNNNQNKKELDKNRASGKSDNKQVNKPEVKNNSNYSSTEEIIKKASEKYKIPDELIKAVIKQESNFNEKAVSNKGAMGLMQLMPDTAKLLNVGNPFDIEENIFGGTKYLRDLIDLYNGNLNKALAAYNAGPSRVNNGIPEIPETKNFISSVIEYYKKFSKTEE